MESEKPNPPAKLDRKDKEILLELDTDATQSYKKIGKKLRISKEMVAYRIKRLEEQNLINSYLTLSHFSKMGFTHFKLYITFSHITNQKKQEIIEYVKNQENIGWLASTEGGFDLMIAIRYRDVFEFEKFKDEFFSKFDKYFQKKSFAILTEVETYPRKYFTEQTLTPPKVFSFCTPAKEVPIDESDLKIIKALSENSKQSAIELERKIGLSERIIRYRKKQLEKKGILVGYKLALNYRKLGYHFFKCLVKFQKMTPKRLAEFKAYVRNHPNIIYWIKVVGEWDLELEVEAPSMEEFYKVTNNIRVEFNDVIQTFDSVLVSEEHAISHA